MGCPAAGDSDWPCVQYCRHAECTYGQQHAATISDPTRRSILLAPEVLVGRRLVGVSTDAGSLHAGLSLQSVPTLSSTRLAALKAWYAGQMFSVSRIVIMTAKNKKTAAPTVMPTTAPALRCLMV